jgi:hypothetical protein
VFFNVWGVCCSEVYDRFKVVEKLVVIPHKPEFIQGLALNY